MKAEGGERVARKKRNPGAAGAEELLTAKGQSGEDAKSGIARGASAATVQVRLSQWFTRGIKQEVRFPGARDGGGDLVLRTGESLDVSPDELIRMETQIASGAAVFEQV